MALSDMMAQGGGPPPSIQVPGSEPAPDDSGGGSSDPNELVSQAIDLIRQALDAEPDHEDKLLLEKITTMGQQYLATQQKTTDAAMGAGPAAKMIRKTSGGPSGY